MATNYYGHRAESFRVDLLDLHGRVLRTLKSVDDSGQLEFTIANAVRGTGSITLHYAEGTDIDWTKSRVRVWYVIGEDETPLITAIPAVPTERHTATGVTLAVDLFDKLLILSDDAFDGSYGVAAATNVLSAVASIIASTGEPASSFVYPESTVTLAAGMVWEAGVSKLTIVNDLLDAGGFFALRCDGMGQYFADPYTAPASRPVAWTFVDDAKGLYLPTFTASRDVSKVPNKYVCIGRTEGDTAALKATATDTSNGPFSYSSRGRWITRTETNVEAASQAVLDAIAARKLSYAQQVSQTFEFQHAWVPVGLNEVVEFSNTRTGKARCVVQRQVVKLATGGLVTSTLRKLT